MHIRNIVASVCALMGACLLWAPAGAHADTWIKAESAHFVIYSDASEKHTRDYLRKLEAFRSLTNILLGSSDKGPQVKFEVYLLAKDDLMLSVRPSFTRYVGGVYFNCSEGTSAYASVGQFGDDFGEQDSSLVTLFHEYTHYVMFQHARILYPSWYVEGFAEYLSTADPHDGTITVGELQRERTYTLSEDHWIDFKKVLDPNYGFSGDQKANAWELASFYAQSWLLTHYMLADPARARTLNDYFARVGKGEDPVGSFEAATGIKVADLRGILDRYQNNMHYHQLPLPDYPDADIQVTKVTADEGSFLLNRSLLTTCMTDTQGKTVLETLTAQKATLGGNLQYRLALIRAEFLYGDLNAAEAEVSKLVDSNPADFEVNYLMGRVYMKRAETATGADRDALYDAARGFFLTAYQATKLDAPNLYWVARSYQNQKDFPNANALNAANAAHVLAPGIIEYATFAAYADLLAGQRDKAADALSPFISDPHNRARAARIKAAVDAIKAGKTTKEVMALLNGSSDNK
ncbi:MAG TPA: hypothetical protein VG839_04750 [Asticcacaulis sp.]|nr:hypothetical protein [Asticcacaulis sp.]